MKDYIIVFSLCLIMSLGSHVFAADSVEIRMVNASNNGEGVDSQLADVAALLTTQLPFKRIQFLAKNQSPLPPSEPVMLPLDYSVLLTGDQLNLNITVKHGDNAILNTIAQLWDHKPLILGGFPADNGKIILILLAKNSVAPQTK